MTNKDDYFDFAKYNADFMKKTYKRITTLIPKSDVEVIEHLNKQKSVSSYILNLIKEDIKKQGAK